MNSNLIFWGIIVLVVASMVIFGMVSSSINRYKAKRHIQRVVGEVPFKLKNDQGYHLILSSGKRYENIKILGVTEGI